MATQPSAGTPRHFGSPKTVTFTRTADRIRLRDTVARSDRQAVKGADRARLSPMMRAVLAQLNDLEANVKAIADHVNLQLAETVENERLVVERINGILAAVDNATSKLSKKVGELVMFGTLAQRPAAAGSGRYYWATDQAAGSRFRFDDPTSGAWIAP